MIKSCIANSESFAQGSSHEFLASCAARYITAHPQSVEEPQGRGVRHSHTSGDLPDGEFFSVAIETLQDVESSSCHFDEVTGIKPIMHDDPHTTPALASPLRT